MIANVIFIMQVICHSLSVLSMFLYGLCGVYVTFRLSVHVSSGHCSETDWIVEEVSGATGVKPV